MNFTCVRRVQGTIAVHVKCKKKSRDCIILVTYLHDFSPNFHESCACTHSTSLRSVRSRSFAIWTMDKDSIKNVFRIDDWENMRLKIFKEANLQARNWRFSSKNFCTLDFLTKLEMSRKGDGVSRSSGKTFQFDFLQKTSCYSKLSIEWEKLTIEKCSAASCAKPDNLSSFSLSKENFKNLK